MRDTKSEKRSSWLFENFRHSNTVQGSNFVTVFILLWKLCQKIVYSKNRDVYINVRVVVRNRKKDCLKTANDWWCQWQPENVEKSVFKKGSQKCPGWKWKEIHSEWDEIFTGCWEASFLLCMTIFIYSYVFDAYTFCAFLFTILYKSLKSRQIWKTAKYYVKWVGRKHRRK